MDISIIIPAAALIAVVIFILTAVTYSANEPNAPPQDFDAPNQNLQQLDPEGREERREQVVINQCNHPQRGPSTNIFLCCIDCSDDNDFNHHHYGDNDSDCNCCDDCDDGCTGCFD